MKKQFSLLVFALLSLSCFCTQSLAQDTKDTVRWLTTATAAEKYSFWAQLSSEINKLLPMNIDSETIALSASPQADGVVWNYRLVNYQYSDRSKREWDNALAEILEASKPYFCTIPDTAFFREANAAIKTNYFGRNGKYIGSMSFYAGGFCGAAKFDPSSARLVE